MTEFFIRREDTQRYTEKRSFDKRGRDWSDVSRNQGTLRIADNTRIKEKGMEQILL